MDYLDIELFDEFRTCLEIMIVDTQITCRGYSLFSILASFQKLRMMSYVFFQTSNVKS